MIKETNFIETGTQAAICFEINLACLINKWYHILLFICNRIQIWNSKHIQNGTMLYQYCALPTILENIMIWRLVNTFKNFTINSFLIWQSWIHSCSPMFPNDLYMLWHSTISLYFSIEIITMHDKMIGQKSFTVNAGNN